MIDAGSRPEARPHESGQALPLMALVLIVAITAILALARIGGALDDSARARTAADAAALAGAVDGRAGARSMAEQNGGTLVEFVQRGEMVDVEVRVGDSSATARAGARVEWKARPGG